MRLTTVPPTGKVQKENVEERSKKKKKKGVVN